MIEETRMTMAEMEFTAYLYQTHDRKPIARGELEVVARAKSLEIATLLNRGRISKHPDSGGLYVKFTLTDIAIQETLDRMRELKLDEVFTARIEVFTARIVEFKTDRVILRKRQVPVVQAYAAEYSCHYSIELLPDDRYEVRFKAGEDHLNRFASYLASITAGVSQLPGVDLQVFTLWTTFKFNGESMTDITAVLIEISNERPNRVAYKLRSCEPSDEYPEDDVELEVIADSLDDMEYATRMLISQGLVEDL